MSDKNTNILAENVDEFLKNTHEKSVKLQIEINSLQNKIEKYEKLKKNDVALVDNELSKYHDEIIDEFYSVQSEINEYYEQSIEVPVKIRDYVSNQLERLKKITIEQENYYSKVKKNINSSLAICSGALLIINFLIPNIDTVSLMAFGFFIIIFLSIVFYRKKINNSQDKFMLEIDELHKDILLYEPKTIEFEKMLSELKDSVIKIRGEQNND